jgi:N-acyl-D-aspartate/D-glutamate deacylase
VGKWADIVVFDPARVIDGATYEAPTRLAVGVVATIVGGEVCLRARLHRRFARLPTHCAPWSLI